MTKFLLAAALLAVSAVAPRFAAAEYDRVTDSFNAKCNYRCCDQNRNCSVHNFYLGGKTSWPKSCDWATVCSKQGTIGWSYGGTPTEANSSLTTEKGCWQRWEGYRKNKMYAEVRPCEAATKSAAVKSAAHKPAAVGVAKPDAPTDLKVLDPKK